MKKPFILLALLIAASMTLTGGTPSRASGLLFREDANFKGLISAAEYYEKANRPAEAAHYYRLAIKRAANDAERAQAHLGVAKYTPIRYSHTAEKDFGVDKIAAYQNVVTLPDAPATAKIEAYFGKAEVQAATTQYDAALTSLKALAEIPEATPEQKRKALLWRGEILVQAKRYDEARTTLADLIKAPDAKFEENLAAHQAIARSHLRQVNFTDALAEIARINALPGPTDEQRADIHIANGTMLAEAGHHKAARDEYAKVAVLADATVEKNFVARYKIGESYFNEKNYLSAREAWTQAVELRGAEKHAADVWKAIGIANVFEKNYEKAREAYQKWLAVPTLDFKGKVLAWQHIAASYTEEKKYAEAREALGNISKLAPANATFWDNLQFKLRQEFDIADVYRTEGDFTRAGETYVAILQDVPVSTTLQPPFYNEAREQVQKAAGALAKDKASMTAAYTVYEALEKVYPYAKQDAEAFLGMGDILLAQGKPAEAKEKYQKALELRKTYDEGKLAQEKISKIEAQEKAPGAP